MIGHYALHQYLKVNIADDKSVAYLEFVKREDDFACTAEEVYDFLTENGIRHGIQHDMVQRFAGKPDEYFFSKVPIALGTPPEIGEDGRVVLSLQVDDEESHRPLEMENGQVDYKEIVRLSNVRKGQLIAELLPPTTGMSGINVLGEELPGKTGKATHFRVGKNVLVSGEGDSMYAAIDGLVSKTEKGKINVFPVYEVKGDVDYSTGNIDFVGTVVIRGNVLTGFSVKSAGDIRVIGGVEGAELTAGGSIEITGGIIGYNKGLVSAGHDVKVSFIQDGNVAAGQDVIVSQSIMHSNVRAGRDILCNGPKGLIVGGVAQAGEKVVARTIGNTMSTATSIEVGVLPELRNEINDLRHELRTLMENADKTQKALNLLNQLAMAGTLSADKMALRVKLNATKQSQLREESRVRERILEIERMLEDTDRAKVEVIRTIYGGSKIVIGRYTRYLKDQAERVAFRYMDGDITMTPHI